MGNRVNQDILYKYRHFNNVFNWNVLEKNQLYFASPQELNDCYDMALKPFLKNITKEDIITYYYNAIDNGYFDNSGFSRIEQKKNVDLQAHDIDKFKKDYNFNFQEAIFNCTILSLSKVWNKILMWAHYGYSNTGYCIGFDGKILDGLLNEIFYFETNYVNKIDLNHPLTNMEDISFYNYVFSTKYDVWEYEQEVRFVSSNMNSKRIKLIEIPNSLIKEVILGINCTDDNKTKVINIIKKKDCGIKLYEVFQEEYEFNIKRKEIPY